MKTVRTYTQRPAKCTADDGTCGPVVSRGFCSKHYARYRKYGDPSVVKGGSSSVDPEQRFSSKYLVDDESGCWLWTGAMNGNGWAILSVGGKAMMAHRFAYETFVGPIPEGDSVSRTCGKGNCVNPEHLALKSNDPEARFWKNVNKQPGDGCWLWRPAVFMYRAEGKLQSPRRYLWTLMREEPREPLYSLCGNTKCVRPNHAGTAKDRFWSKVDKAEDGCWYWLGSKLSSGYPHLTYEGKSWYAHRLSYEWAGGMFEDGYVLTHRCGHKDCVNPRHLEQISVQEMVDRREAKRTTSDS